MRLLKQLFIVNSFLLEALGHSIHLVSIKLSDEDSIRHFESIGNSSLDFREIILQILLIINLRLDLLISGVCRFVIRAVSI